MFYSMLCDKHANINMNIMNMNNIWYYELLQHHKLHEQELLEDHELHEHQEHFQHHKSEHHQQ